ncbi:YbjN domain-containing protein [Pseudomonas chlororaphis]|uniref:YbjN domain-containing protein n=1 Tax=Pseudomonas chlororaphis TaxID=587753 RepID=UPI002368CADA|nr:YbjN domain-containing protein [Pseudomonas chlororaphis]WDH38081.1 YbjN domain-containing protein [Pseudomonas chlororaphis]WDH44168.1 YbjN domain-containing protein [Pseudomonas chlororaphis]
MTEQAQLIASVTPQSLTELLQGAGYRVNQTDQNGIVQLLSASQGIGYAVRFGNVAAEPRSYVDFTFSCALRVQGELPAGLAELWNASRRFARLSVQGEFLVMEMDVVVAGVGADHLRSQLELWDRLLQEFIVYLRDYSQHAARLQAQPEATPQATPETMPEAAPEAFAEAVVEVPGQ